MLGVEHVRDGKVLQVVTFGKLGIFIHPILDVIVPKSCEPGFSQSKLIVELIEDGDSSNVLWNSIPEQHG